MSHPPTLPPAPQPVDCAAMPSPKHPVVRLLPNRHKRAKAGHPWVYSNEVAMTAAAKALEPGSLVTLVSDHGEGFGTAMFNPRSLIAARRLDPAAGAESERECPGMRTGREMARRRGRAAESGRG